MLALATTPKNEPPTLGRGRRFFDFINGQSDDNAYMHPISK